MWPSGDLEEAQICPGVAPWTSSRRRSLQAPKLCVPCLSPRPPCSKASTAALCWSQQLLLAVRRGETALCRTGEVTTLLQRIQASRCVSLVHFSIIVYMVQHDISTRFDYIDCADTFIGSLYPKSYGMSFSKLHDIHPIKSQGHQATQGRQSYAVISHLFNLYKFFF